MPRRLLECRSVVVLVSLLLLASGTPQVVAQEQAQAALSRQVAVAAMATRLEGGDRAIARVGLAPALDEIARFNGSPTPSGANPLYPPNHTFDGDEQPVGTPPANHDFSVPGYAVGVPPSNYDLQAAAESVGTPPTNHDFETGTLTGWTTAGTVALQSNGTQGSYAQLTSNGDLTSDAFTVDASTQALLVEIGLLATPGFNSVTVSVLSGSSYATTTTLRQVSCTSCASWSTESFDLTAFRGTSVKLRFQRTFGTIGIDAPRTMLLFADVTTSGSVARVSEANGNVYARLEANGTLISAAFTVDSAAQFVTLRNLSPGASAGQYELFVLSGSSYATETKVLTKTNVPAAWAREPFNAAPWHGQSIKLKIKRLNSSLGVDDIGLQTVDIPGWQVTGGTAWIGLDGDNPYVVVGNSSSLISEAFTLDSQAQHLTLRYRADTASPTFYPELLRGPSFSEVVTLTPAGLYVGDANQSAWQTFTGGVALYAGETVKLRLRAYLGRTQFDDVGLTQHLLAHWTPTMKVAVRAGEDSAGSYVQAHNNASVTLRSELISTGIIDRPNTVDMR
jgi:hypothetical protein